MKHFIVVTFDTWQAEWKNHTRTQLHRLTHTLICKFVNNKYRNYGSSISFSRHANSERHLGEREITYGFCLSGVSGAIRLCVAVVTGERRGGGRRAALKKSSIRPRHSGEMLSHTHTTNINRARFLSPAKAILKIRNDLCASARHPPAARPAHGTQLAGKVQFTDKLGRGNDLRLKAW